MQNHSLTYFEDSSSEELSSGEEEELWNPNDSIDQIAKIEDKALKEKLKIQLLEKFLDQRRPFLTAKMKTFLNEEGIFERMISYVTRLDEAQSEQYIKIASTSPVPVPRPLVTPLTEQLVRRSFNVTEVFVNPSDELDEIIETRLNNILKLLFLSFQQNSSANFYHFEKILDSILARAPVETTKLLLSDNLFWILFSYLHEQAVVDALLSLFTCEFPKQSDTIHFYKSLVEAKVFDKIGEKIYTLGSFSALPVAEFFVKLIDRLASFEMSGILFIGLVRSPNFMNNLFKTLINEGKEYPESQQKAAALVIRELLIKSGEKMFDQSDLRPLPNMLSAIHDKIHEFAKPHVGKLGDLLISIDAKAPSVAFSSYVVPRPFGLFRFTVLEILSDIICCIPDSVTQFSPHVWKYLCSWFIEYSNNNMYHCLFYKILEVVVHHNYVESLKLILGKYKFLTRICDFYKANPKTPSKGFLLNIINIFRLAGDLQPMDGYLRHHLNSHEKYTELLPSIKEETIRQLKRYNDLEGLEEEEEEEGLDLGSAYARSLGFDQEPPPPPEKKKKKKKKKRKTGTASSNTSPANLRKLNPAVPKTPVEHLKPEVKNPDDDSDPKDSAATWWKSLKTELTVVDEQKTNVGNSWWDSLKEELKQN